MIRFWETLATAENATPTVTPPARSARDAVHETRRIINVHCDSVYPDQSEPVDSGRPPSPVICGSATDITASDRSPNRAWDIWCGISGLQGS